MKIAIGNDHRAVDLKFKIMRFLEKEGHEVINVGSDEKDFSNFPAFAFKVGEMVSNKEIDLGILICGTGTGMSLACNKVKGAYCAKISDKREAFFAKSHNDANVISFSAFTSFSKIKKYIKIFMETEVSSVPRYHERIQMIKEYENGN